MGRNLPALPSPAEETWFVFGILAEFVDGFEPISLVPPAVSIFGSARSQVVTFLTSQTCILDANWAKVGLASESVRESMHRGWRRLRSRPFPCDSRERANSKSADLYG